MQLDNGKATNRDGPQDRRTDAGGSDDTTTRLGTRYTVQEAAEILGASVDAVRGRIRRGTLDSMRVDGLVYVLLDETSRDRHSEKSTNRLGETSPDQPADPNQSELLGELRDQINWLRREVERKDTIIMALTQRVPELEAPANKPVEWLGDEESLREDKGMSTRPDEVRQSWHAPTHAAPRVPRGVPETASETSTGAEVREEDTDEPQRSSWWRRFFGFE